MCILILFIHDNRTTNLNMQTKNKYFFLLFEIQNLKMLLYFLLVVAFYFCSPLNLPIMTNQQNDKYRQYILQQYI